MRTAEDHQRKSRGTAVIWGLVLLAPTLWSCRNKDGENDMARTTRSTVAELQVTSSVFEEAGMIPAQYTCDGESISPPLRWESLPEGTRSIALIVDDPDAPSGTFVHWVLYDLPPGVQELSAGMPGKETLANGARQGANDFGDIGYGAPAPPRGTHRYFFKVYALDAVTGLPPGQTKAQLLRAMEGHILAQGQIMGKYKRR
jgi:Raf kinase inhibitor-like YbhB/YbcL family protein